MVSPTLDEDDYKEISRPLVAVGKDFPRGLHFAPHIHKRAQFMYAVEGAMEITTETGKWMVPPTRAVWIPSEMGHHLRATGFVAMKTLYIDSKACSGLPDTCRVLNVTPLLRELVTRATQQPRAYEVSSRQERLVTMIFDEIQQLESLPCHLPMPVDTRLAPLKEKAAQNDLGHRSVEELSRLAGTSSRNLTRIFRRETGLTPGQWRRNAQLRAALTLLAENRSVTEVALEVGFENASSFIASFKRAFGETPGKYYRNRNGADVVATGGSRHDHAS